MLREILIVALAVTIPAAAAWADASVDADGVVTIHPGETIAVGFAGVDDPSHPTLASDTNAPATMTFAFTAQAGLGLILEIHNHLGVTVKYDAVMVVGGRSVHTSSFPVLARIMGTENWRDPITELKLSGFRKLDGTSIVCD